MPRKCAIVAKVHSFPEPIECVQFSILKDGMIEVHFMDAPFSYPYTRRVTLYFDREAAKTLFSYDAMEPLREKEEREALGREERRFAHRRSLIAGRRTYTKSKPVPVNRRNAEQRLPGRRDSYRSDRRKRS